MPRTAPEPNRVPLLVLAAIACVAAVPCPARAGEPVRGPGLVSPIWRTESGPQLDQNHNRLDDELELLPYPDVDNPGRRLAGGPGQVIEAPHSQRTDLLIEFYPQPWSERRDELVDTVQTLVWTHFAGRAGVQHDYSVVPAAFVVETRLHYPLWDDELGYLDPFLADLLDPDAELSIRMVHALHRFHATSDSKEGAAYNIADRVRPDTWRRAQLSDPGSTQCDGRGRLIAIVDTGIHSLPTDRLLCAGGYDATTGFEGNPPDLSFADLRHGTRVGYVATGVGSAAATGICGVAPLAAFLDINIVSSTENGYSATSADLLSALDWIYHQADATFSTPGAPARELHGIDVVNISFADGGPVAHRFVPGSGDACESFQSAHGQDPVSKAVNQLVRARDLPVVVAAGNCGAEGEGFGELAAASEAITVGAYDMAVPADRGDDTIYAWSNHGPDGLPLAEKPELVAPGDALGDVGTSFAAPQVAGAILLLRQAYPELDGSAIREVLIESADAVDPGPRHDEHWGHGRLDVRAALASLRDSMALPPLCEPQIEQPVD